MLNTEPSTVDLLLSDLYVIVVPRTDSEKSKVINDQLFVLNLLATVKESD